MSEQQVQRQNTQPATLFIFLFGRIVHRTIRIWSNSLKPLFGTPIVIIQLQSTDMVQVRLPMTYRVQTADHWIFFEYIFRPTI